MHHRFSLHVISIIQTLANLWASVGPYCFIFSSGTEENMTWEFIELTHQCAGANNMSHSMPTSQPKWSICAFEKFWNIKVWLCNTWTNRIERIGLCLCWTCGLGKVLCDQVCLCLKILGSWMRPSMTVHGNSEETEDACLKGMVVFVAKYACGLRIVACDWGWLGSQWLVWPSNVEESCEKLNKEGD